jgi:uncharacterized membrane protein
VGAGHGHAHGRDESWSEVGAGSARRVLLVAVALIGLAALVGLAVWWPGGGDAALDKDALGFGDRVEATVTSAETGPCGGGGADPGAAMPGDPGGDAGFDPPADPGGDAGFDPPVDPGAADGTAAPADPGVDPGLDPSAGGGAGDQSDCVVVTARITGGGEAGDTAELRASTGFDSPVSRLREGDGVVLSDNGAELPNEVRYSFADRQRSTPMLALAVVFAAVVIALGRLRGLLALVGIGLSLAVLLGFIFPALLEGASPVGVALTGATIIAFGTLYLAHGFNDRTTVALLGTMASLGLTAALAVGFAKAAELTGLASEESLTLLSFAPELDFRGLLLAAIVIGTLGVLDDVTVTQVAAVWELRAADPTISRHRLYGAGIRIGRDHIASTVNTLVLAYSAAALPLLLIYTQSGLAFGDVLTSETVGVEIVQTLVGSIGLVASVPLTTALACWVATRTDAGEDARDDMAAPEPGWGPPGGGQGWATQGWDARPAPGRVPAPTAAPAPDRRRPPARNPDDFWTNNPW